MRKLEWGEANVQLVHTVDELDRFLDRLSADAAKEPFGAVLVLEDGSALTIGLGRDFSVVSSIGKDGDPPYFISSNGREDDDDDADPLVFFFGGQWSEFPASSAISVATARSAIRYFFETGQLSQEITWREG